MLQKLATFPGIAGPVVTIVLDGYGLPKNDAGSAIAAARKPVLDRLFAECPNIRLRAHGTAVGMPSDDDMGNSEVGHNAIGAGQVYAQGAALVANAIASGDIWRGEAWQQIVAGARNGTLHFIGLFSDGNVHSHIDHLKAMVVQARAEGLKQVRIHALLDGRDVPETSALEYVVPFEAFLAEVSTDGFDARIASGGGRQNITMDRYDANWPMVEKGWKTHVLGEGPQFANATEAVKALREQNPGTIDQDLPPFVIGENGKPVGPIVDGDSVVFYNFRGDRAIEITRAFVEANFDRFDRVRAPQVTYAGMLQYDGDLQLPKRFLVAPPAIKDTMGEWFAKSGVTQFACSETQKFGHVTYFWNGNRTGAFDPEREKYVEIPSHPPPFEQKPEMRAREISECIVAELAARDYKLVRLNYANGDMVGHTGNFDATVKAVEAVDSALALLVGPVLDRHGALVVIADHGNADDKAERNKKTGEIVRDTQGRMVPKTSHTLNPVPCYILLAPSDRGRFALASVDRPGLGNIAATIAALLGFAPPAGYLPSLVRPT